jgi:AraC family transcriptional regulator
MNVVQLYLSQATLERISGEADKAAPGDLLKRTAHPDYISAAP